MPTRNANRAPKKYYGGSGEEESKGLYHNRNLEVMVNNLGAVELGDGPSILDTRSWSINCSLQMIVPEWVLFAISS